MTDSGDPFLFAAIPIISADGVGHYEINNLQWGWTPDYGTSDFVWSPDSRLLAFLDDALMSDGEVFLETGGISGTIGQERLKGGLGQSPVALAWQRSPGR